MKKKLFNKWYNKYGKSFASMTFPLGEDDEKEIRKRAKQIYNTVYDDVTKEFRDSLLIAQDGIYDKIIELKADIAKSKDFLQFLNEKREDFISSLTVLYDNYYRNQIPLEVFQYSKKVMADELDNIRIAFLEHETNLSMMKDALKKYDFLLGDYFKIGCDKWDDCGCCCEQDCDCDCDKKI